MSTTEETGSTDNLKNHEPHSNEPSAENPAFKCDHKRGPNVRNLVVCIDGTAGQFGDKMTNVLELYDLVQKGPGANQLAWYISDIGTTATPSSKSFAYYIKSIDHTIDLAVGWNFEDNILAAYSWLCKNYQQGDHIFVFGYSRGAFQVRVLAAMIDKVGLLRKDGIDKKQVALAYRQYIDPKESRAEEFTRTFGLKASVHFVGVWDTVSSIGAIRGKFILPGTIDGMKHVCYFRQALALDERRVKFSPEYAYGGSATSLSDEPVQPTQNHVNSEGDALPHTLEVWFAGTHADIGGSSYREVSLDRTAPPLRWMVSEASAAGLRSNPFRHFFSPKKQIEIQDSLSGIWWIFEYLPLTRLTYTAVKGKSQLTHKFHKGEPRKIHNGQKIHRSLITEDVLGEDEYVPKARPIDDSRDFWRKFRTVTGGHEEWMAVDLFEQTHQLVNKFIIYEDESVWGVLRQTAETVEGRRAVFYAMVTVLQDRNTMLKITLPFKAEFIDKIMNILVQTTPFTRLEPKKALEMLADLRESDNKDHFDVSEKFLSLVTTETKVEKTPRFVQRFIIHREESVLDTLRQTAETVEGRQAVYDTMVAVLQDQNTMLKITLPFKAEFIDQTMKILVQAGIEGMQFARLELRKAWGIVVDLRESNNEYYINVAKEFVRLFTTQTTVEYTTITKRRLDVAVPGDNDQVILSIAVLSVGTHLVAGLSDWTILGWDAATGNPVNENSRESTAPVHAVVVSTNGDFIVSGSQDGNVHIWNAETGMSLLGRHTRSVKSLVLSPNGKLVASGSEDQTIQIWDVDRRIQACKPLSGHKGTVFAIRFTHGGRRLVSCSSDMTVRFWDVNTGESLKAPLDIKYSEEWLLSAALSSDGRRLAAGFSDNSVRVWDLEKRKMVGEPFQVHEDLIVSVAFSPDNRRIVSGSSDGIILVWDVETGQPEKNFKLELGVWVRAVAFFPDGKRVVGGCDEGKIVICSTELSDGR